MRGNQTLSNEMQNNNRIKKSATAGQNKYNPTIKSKFVKRWDGRQGTYIKSKHSQQ